MDKTDEELVRACRHGDEAAWEALVTRYQRLVYSVARRSGLDGDAAADVFQHVFTALLQQIDRIEQPERIGGWLATTARRESWRSRKRERATVRHGRLDDENADDRAETLRDDAPLPDEVLLRMEEQSRVRRGVDALDERCRTLIVLLFYRADPPPYAEIAATLGTSEGSIGPRRARCLEKLRRLLQE